MPTGPITTRDMRRWRRNVVILPQTCTLQAVPSRTIRAAARVSSIHTGQSVAGKVRIILRQPVSACAPRARPAVDSGLRLVPTGQTPLAIYTGRSLFLWILGCSERILHVTYTFFFGIHLSASWGT